PCKSVKSVVKTTILLAATCLLFSCGRDANSQTETLSCTDFTIQNFSPIANWQTDSASQKTIFLDYDNAIGGFVVPSVKQLKGGVFSFQFEVKNNASKPQNLYYKIYYQNESYKFPEYDSVSKAENALAEENFYGSWENTTTTFKKIAVEGDNAFHKIEDVFRIIGNPRNEDRYIQKGINNRWQRNPRVGNYSFLLVIASENDLKNIPSIIQNINQKDKDHFANPYFFFRYGEGKKMKGTIATVSNTQLKVVAQPKLGAGIYVDDARFNGDIDKSHFCATCGQDSNLYYNAPIQQFINYVDMSTKMDNIPVIADVLKDNYSKMDYNWNRAFYTKDELIPTILQTSKHPCATVFSDPKEKKIIIKNPKTEFGEWKKESVGIITRHGLTYGKYRVKVKLTELLNKNNVWNGLTNAIWLITQGGGEWNFRRSCNKDGYMASYWGGPNDKRIPAVDYSEIDFEILKTPPYCPDYVFPPVYKNSGDNNKNNSSWNIPLPEEITNTDGNVTVACTNWDMACHEPKSFGIGCNPVNYKNQTFEAHRWDQNYRALTEKKEESDDELFGSDFFYFEIDWRPTEIIWRIGASPDKMRVVGYMNDKVTSIPNNQMLLIITQEYHNTKWWPGAPYSQDNLPFPLNDIPGEIYDLTIE
ncbi:MAG: hypothetical protein NTX97_12225, partial [Bacteroidetes bacterium]|nr:hypothetical protein [Bacteroidota bacterium]